ncbi:uncharacterized protein LOC144680443 [Cetorhinus maximus]
MRPFRCSGKEQPVPSDSYQKPVYRHRRIIRSLYSFGIRGDFSSDRNALLGPVNDPIQSTSQSAGDMQQPVSQIPQTDLTPITRVPTNQGQSKCLANAPASESLSKRKRSPSPKLWSVPTPSTGCKDMIKTIPVQHRMTADHSSARGVEDDEVLKHMQKDTSDGDEQSEDTAVTPTSHQEDAIQSTSQSANEMQQPVSQIPQTDLTPITRVPTSQGHRKCLAKTPDNESLSKRKRSLSPKLWSAPTPSTGCKYMIKMTPVQHRMTAGHFSAWGVEDDEVLKHMQKDTSDGDEQSEDTAVTPTSHQEDPIQSTSQSANEMQQPVSQIPQTDLTPIARVPTNQGHRKCLAKTPDNESRSKRVEDTDLQKPTKALDIQKDNNDGDEQSEDTAVTPTSHQEETISKAVVFCQRGSDLLDL